MTIRLFRRVLLSISLFATTGIALFLILSSPSPSWTIDIGTPGDTHFLRNAYLPEFSNDTSFRWTGPGSQLVLHSTNSEPVILDLRIYTDGNNSLFQCNQLRLEQFRKIITTFERQNGWRTYQILLAEGQVSGKKVIAQPLDLICDQYQTSYLDNRRLGVPLDWVRVRFLKPSFQSPTIISGIPIKRSIMLTFYLVLAFGISLIFTQKKEHLAIITAITAVALMFWATYNPHTLSWVQRDLQVQTWILPIVLCSYVIVAVVLLWLYNQSKVDRLSISMSYLTYRIESYIVVAIIAIGSVFRFVHFLFVDLHLPFRLGGLYLEFARQIVKHRYMLPDRIPYYTDGGIPFAYPPLPFYIEAVLVDIFHFPVFMVVNLLPPVVSLLSLVSFYILTRELKLELPIKVAALFAYALIPSAFMDQTEAAGLAESFGSLAMIWLVITLIRADRSRSTIAYSLVGLSWGICIVASPGSAYASFLTTMLFFALQLTVHSQQKDRLPLIQCMSISAVIAILLTSPYWLTVISNHGLGVFTTSFGAQHDGAFLGIISAILEAIFEHGFPGAGFGYISYLWGGVICIGLINLLSRRQLTLPLWFIVCFSVPREGGWLASIPMAILAGFGIVTVFKTLPVITQLWKPERPLKISLYLCLITFFFGGLFLDTQTRFQERVTGQYKKEIYFNSYYGITYADIEAMEWIKNNTPSEAKFVVLARDQVLEWLPFVAQRTIMNTPFGSEWEPIEGQRILQLNGQLRSCRNTTCFYDKILHLLEYKRVYFYIDQYSIEKLGGRPCCEGKNTQVLYENNEVIIGYFPYF